MLVSLIKFYLQMTGLYGIKKTLGSLIFFPSLIWIREDVKHMKLSALKTQQLICYHFFCHYICIHQCPNSLINMIGLDNCTIGRSKIYFITVCEACRSTIDHHIIDLMKDLQIGRLVQNMFPKKWKEVQPFHFVNDIMQNGISRLNFCLKIPKHVLEIMVY